MTKRTLDLLKKIRDIDNILNQEYIIQTGDNSPRDARWEAVIEDLNEEIDLLTKEQTPT